MKKTKILGVYDLPIGLCELNPQNERETMTLEGIVDLADSIRRTQGNVTPAIAELIRPQVRRITPKRLKKLIDEENAFFRVLGGNRRYIAIRLLRLPSMKAKVLYGLDDEERLEICVIENSTKRRIPPFETAASMWGLYQYSLAMAWGAKDEESISRYPDYWSVPEQLRQRLSMAAFAKAIHKSASTVASAFYYERCNEKVKGMVRKGRLSYSVAAELGRITDKNAQMVQLVRAGKRYPGKLRPQNVSGHVTEYLKALASDDPGSLQLRVQQQKRNLYKGLMPELRGLSAILKKIMYVAEHDASILESNGNGAAESLESILCKISGSVDALHSRYSENPVYQSALDARSSPGFSLVSRLLSGSVDIESSQESIERLRLDEACYEPALPIEKIHRCESQPRKTFPDSDLESMANTIRRYGILQTIMVRPKAGSYEIVVGETRWRAAKIAGEKCMDALVLPMDDVVAQIVRYEEDLFEEVIPRERAKRLHWMWQQKKALYGDAYSIDRFLADVGVQRNTVMRDFQYASLDDSTRFLHEAGLLNYTNAVMLAGIAPEQRFQYAFAAIALNLSSKRLEQYIFTHESGQYLPMGYDFAAERLNSLRGRIIDEVTEKAALLLPGKHHDNRLYSLMQNLTKREHFMHLCEIKHSSDCVKRILSRSGQQYGACSSG